MIASSGGVCREQVCVCVCVCVCVWRPFPSCAAGTLLSCSHASASFDFPHLSACIALISYDSINQDGRKSSGHKSMWPVCGENVELGDPSVVKLAASSRLRTEEQPIGILAQLVQGYLQ